MYSFLSNIYPKNIRGLFFSLLGYFEIKVRKEFVLGTLIFFITGASLILSLQFSKAFFGLISPAFPGILGLIVFFILTFFILHFAVYTSMSMIATNRGKFVEKILPDALELVAANLRAGMTIDRALIASNRAEFGYLNFLLLRVGKEITTGTEIGEALLNMTKRVKSEKFAKAIELIVMAMRSGGELSRLLGQVAENLVHQQTIEDKVKAGVTTYLIFIAAAVSFAAPFLYGLSSVFVKIIIKSFSTVDIPQDAAKNIPFQIKMSPEMAEFLPDFVRLYATISLCTLGIMSSFLLGLIKRGKAKFGISFIPFIVGSSLFIYLAVSGGANWIFSSIM